MEIQVGGDGDRGFYPRSEVSPSPKIEETPPRILGDLPNFALPIYLVAQNSSLSRVPSLRSFDFQAPVIAPCSFHKSKAVPPVEVGDSFAPFTIVASPPVAEAKQTRLEEEDPKAISLSIEQPRSFNGSAFTLRSELGLRFLKSN